MFSHKFANPTGAQQNNALSWSIYGQNSTCDMFGQTSNPVCKWKTSHSFSHSKLFLVRICESHKKSIIPKFSQIFTKTNLGAYYVCTIHVSSLLNPNWHEAGQIYPPYNFWIGFCQLNFYQKFPNIFGGENWDQSG